ncbi:hypothetical protein HanIR_Chr09g0430791 [Helianthus annuus]|nr:hypothetical protein HanIR_Chr09g0430791 [Helianthus annuus]
MLFLAFSGWSTALVDFSTFSTLFFAFSRLSTLVLDFSVLVLGRECSGTSVLGLDFSLQSVLTRGWEWVGNALRAFILGSLFHP